MSASGQCLTQSPARRLISFIIYSKKNMVSKIIKGSLVGAALLLAVPAMASSNISNIQFDNGQTTTSCTPGQTVNMTIRVTVPANEVAELGQVDVVADNLAPALPVQLGSDLGLQEGAHDVQATVTCPQNTGYYTVEYRTAGIYGGQRAVNITDGMTSFGSFSNALRVTSSDTGSSTGGTTPGTWQDAIAALNAQLAALIASITHPTTPTPAPTTSAVCTAYAQASVGTTPNVYSDPNSRLQGFLISQGASIPALKAGASFGFYGNQTTAAVGWFNSINHCN